MMESGTIETMSFINFVIDFCHTVQGIIIAVASLLSSIALLVSELRKLLKKIEEDTMQSKLGKVIKVVGVVGRILSIVFLIILGIGIFKVNSATEPLPPSARLTNAAWKEYNDKKYKEAIKKAEECIEEFEPTAMRMQRELENNNTPLPPEGKVSEEEKELIFKRGPLNDVATCWFIKGRSLERQGRREEAIQAYCKAKKYIYARTYDPSWDGFWSPAKVAEDRVLYLNEKCE